MNRMYVVAASVVFAAAMAVPAVRAADEMTIKGKVVDVACHKDGKSGAEHDTCAVSCAKRGQPAAVATADGIYVVTGKYAAEKNAKLVEFVNKTVEVKGTVTTKDGQKMIDATSIAVAK